MEREPRETDWNSLTDALLRGVAHALSNRAGALTALRDLGTSDDEGRELLAGEIQRLTELIRLLRLVPAERSALAEALEVPLLVRDAVAVLGLHAQARDVRWTVTVSGAPQPVRAERWVLLRVLLLLCAGALADAAAQGAGELRVTTAGDDAATLASITTGNASTRWRVPDAYARMLADRAGAELRWADGPLELRLPTLAELRRRERGAGER